MKLARSRSRKLVKCPVVVKFPVAVAEVAECAETVKRSLLRTSPSRNLEWRLFSGAGGTIIKKEKKRGERGGRLYYVGYIV